MVLEAAAATGVATTTGTTPTDPAGAITTDGEDGDADPYDSDYSPRSVTGLRISFCNGLNIQGTVLGSRKKQDMLWW
jgi:hypothetical protein